MSVKKYLIELDKVREDVAEYVAENRPEWEPPPAPDWLVQMCEAFHHSVMDLAGWASYPWGDGPKSVEAVAMMVATGVQFFKNLYFRHPTAEDLRTILKMPDASQESMEQAAWWINKLDYAYRRHFPTLYPEVMAEGTETPNDIAIRLALQDGRLTEEDFPCH